MSIIPGDCESALIAAAKQRETGISVCVHNCEDKGAPK